MLYTAALLLSFVNSAFAECPNACSAHGKCGAYDMCSCYRNWMANDCSERICQFGLAHVDVPKGDLDASSGALTMTNLKAPGTIVANVATGSFMYPKGTSEQFPDMIDSSMDIVTNSAHDYAECSNKGSCDRATGNCQCFEGYSGSACQRASCPDTGAGICSGHGTCENIKTISRWDYNNIYKLWDEGATMGCVCDGGYTGSDCSEKICKYGVDPLYLDSFQTYRYNNWTYAVYTSASSTVTGNYSLVYTDAVGENWETIPIDIGARCVEVVHALEGIPNNVIPLGSVECFKWADDFVPGTTAVYEPVTTDHLELHAKFSVAFPSNPGATAQLAIKTKLDGARDTLYSDEGSNTLITRVFSNGFYGENDDFVPDLCEGVTISFATEATKHATLGLNQLASITGDTLKKFKQCLGDANGDMTDNVEVENWDHGTVSTPHLIKVVDATQELKQYVDADTWHHDTPYESSNTYICKQGAESDSASDLCSKADPPGFFVAIYWVAADDVFVVLGRPAMDFSASTTFHVYTTTGRLNLVDEDVQAFNTWNVAGTVAKDNLLTNKLYTKGTSSATRDGLDCETMDTNVHTECLAKDDYAMIFSNTNIWSGKDTGLLALQYASNPIYSQIYQVKKISNEPIPVANWAATNGATWADNANTPPFVRNQIVLDKVINSEFSLDVETAASDTSAQMYKFYPPTNKYTFAGQCSMRGICDTNTGMCNCFAGFDGDSCQRIDALAAR